MWPEMILLTGLYLLSTPNIVNKDSKHFTSYLCLSPHFRQVSSHPNLMTAKQKIKVLQPNYENISPYKDHNHSANICTKLQRTFQIW